MTLHNKNIFGFATIAATVTLSAAIFATGCGDSGDDTPASVSPDKTKNTITINYDTATETALKNNNAESLRWIITDSNTGKQLAIRDAVQKINYPDATTQSDKCYVVLDVPSTVFQETKNVTVTAIYYDKDEHVIGFGSDIDEVTWNSDKETGAISNGSFFSEKDAQYSLTASPKSFNKGEITELAYNVTEGTTTANIIGLVDIGNYSDIEGYIQPEEVKAGEYPTPGRYKGVAYTPSEGATVKIKLDRASNSEYTQSATVYVTDRTSKLSVGVKDHYEKIVLIPENVKAQGETQAADYALGQTKATDSRKTDETYGVRQLPLEVHLDWSEGESDEPNFLPEVDIKDVTFIVRNSSKEAFKSEEVAVENGIVKFKQPKLYSLLNFSVEATYGKATDKLEGQAVPAEVEVGLASQADASQNEFTSEVVNEGTTDLKMYARFKYDTVDASSTSYLFEIPSTAGFTYPSTAALFEGDTIYKVDNPTVTIATADQQKANDYSVTIKKDNKVNDLKVKFLEKETTPYADQIKAFGAFTKLNIDNLLNMVIAPKTEVDPTPSPSPTPGGNPDPDPGDEP